jgi:sialate O-acetylesterase
MVLQRTSRNVSDASITGEASADGKVQARVRKGAKAVKGLDWKTVGSARGGKFEAKLAGVPVGGPYTVELRVDSAPKKSVTVKDVLVGDVWLLGGQSNMQGCGRYEHAEKSHPQVRAFFMNDKWGVAKDPIHNMWETVDEVHIRLCGGNVPKPKKITHSVGPGVAFGVEMQKITDIPQGVIACAHGGTSMDQWNPARRASEDSCLFGAMIRRLQKNGNKVAGLVWYQGESDANEQVHAAYTDRMVDMIQVLRDEAKAPKLPVAIVQLSRVLGWGDRPEWNSIQEQQRTLPEKVKNVVVVPAIDLTLDDSIHVGGPDMNRLGRRLARGMAALTGLSKKDRKPIEFKSVKIEADPYYGFAEIRVKFNNVVGELKSGGARPTGFAVRGPDPAPIYDVTLDGDEAVLHMCGTRSQIQRKFLYYGFGTDPYCNITDSADRSLPVMGPVPVGACEARTDFVRSIEVSELLEGAGKLEAVQYPDGTLQLMRRKFVDDYWNLHPELMNAGDRLVFFRCHFDCPEDMKLAARLGYDGPVKVWIDGEEKLHDPSGINPAIPDKTVIKFDAPAGRREILIALGSNNGAAWGVFLQFERLGLSKELLEKGPEAFAMPKIVE